MPAKQVIIWRHDLNCRLGKKMAQAGHAACATFFRSIENNIDAHGNVSFTLTPAQLEWCIGSQKKIVLRVDSEADLLLLHQRAKELRLPCTLITDAGLTEWDSPTVTCLGVGPDDERAIDELCGERGPLGKLKTL